MNVIRGLVRIALCGVLALLVSPLAGCDVGPSDIFEAAMEDNAEGVRTMLGKDPSLAMARYQETLYRQQTPLHLASTSEVVRILIAAGADVTAGDGIGRTPLHLAANAEVVVYKNMGSGRDADGTPPLGLAGSQEMKELLISHGATD